MESRATKIYSNVNKNAIIRVIPGHFATTHSHINYYVDMTIMKSRKSEAEAAASVLGAEISVPVRILVRLSVWMGVRSLVHIWRMS